MNIVLSIVLIFIAFILGYFTCAIFDENKYEEYEFERKELKDIIANKSNAIKFYQDTYENHVDKKV